ILDVIGQIGVDPGTEWGIGPTSTADNTLRRKAGVCAGDANGTNVFDPAEEWDGFAIDTFIGLGFHKGCPGTPTPTPSGSPTPTPTPTATPAPDPFNWVINEIHADPHVTLGDANGDGMINSAEDEFVEIYNFSDTPR